MAQLIFLGTAGDSAVVGKQTRASGGIVLRVEELQFHINPGPGALTKAKEFGVNLNHNTAILVSDCNINHCNDLNVVIDAMTHAGIEHRGVLLGSKSVLLEHEGNYPFLTRHHQRFLEKVIPLEKDHKVGVDLVEIHAIPTQHADPTAIGFKFFCPQFTISYTGDTGLAPELLQALVGTDILILNVPFPENKSTPYHLDTQAAIKIISHVKPKLAVLTHFGLEMLKADPLVEAREVQRTTGVQTVAAQDGLLISPGQYKSPVKGYS